jgi:hypothetical protein
MPGKPTYEPFQFQYTERVQPLRGDPADASDQVVDTSEQVPWGGESNFHSAPWRPCAPEAELFEDVIEGFD